MLKTLLHHKNVLILCAMMLAGCQSLASENTTDLMRAQMALNVTEIALLRASADDSRVSAGATAQAAGTQTASLNAFNTALYATVQASDDGAIERRVFTNTGGAMPLEMFDLSDGLTRFEQIGFTVFLRDEDRCFEEQNNSFWIGFFERIYLVAVGLNIQPGLNFTVNWFYEGQFMHESTFVSPTFSQYQCIALEINESHAPLQIGNWTAAILVNGEPLETKAFTISAAP